MNINPNTKPIVKHSRRVWKWATIAGILLVVFGLLYWYEPITELPFQNSDYWNDKATDVLILIAALSAAILGIRLTKHFGADEPPHRIWFTFTLGWWAWVGGELFGFVYDYFYWFTDYPEVTFIDVFWVLGYICFGLSLYYQFRLIYSYKKEGKTSTYFAFVAAAFLIAIGLTQLALAYGLGQDSSWFADYLAILYPVFDLFEGAAALWLFFLFGRGYLGRPWWGLIAFAFADALNIFFWLGGYNWMSDQTYYLLDLVSNLAYVAGYLITALAFLAAHEHIERGIISGVVQK